MADHHRVPSQRAQFRRHAPRYRTLAASGAHRANRNDRNLRRQLGALGAQQPEIGSCGDRARCQVHQGWIRNVAVGKHHDIHVLVADDLFHRVFFHDRNARRIRCASQLRWVMSSGNVGDLRCGEGDYLKFRVIAKYDVKVMKISSSSSKDENPFHFYGEASLDP